MAPECKPQGAARAAPFFGRNSKKLGFFLEERVHTGVATINPKEHTMKTEFQYTSRYAETSGRDALANARATMQRALEELDRYIERYDEAEQLKDKANVLNWTLSHLATYVPNNVRLDIIAGAQAELIRAAATK